MKTNFKKSKKKNIFMFFIVCILSTAGFAQNTAASVVGKYEQEAFIAPDNIKESENDVVIKKDPSSSKVVWVENLLPGGRIKAVIFTKGEDNVIYSIPAQRVGGYQIQQGCATYDKTEGKIMISLNNKSNCFGMKQSDYDEGVEISKNGKIKAGGVEINSKGGGSVKGPGTVINDKGIKVDTKTVMAGVQYVGIKQGFSGSSDD